MKRPPKQIISMILCLAIFFSLTAQYAAAEMTSDAPDMSLTAELQIRDRVIDYYFNQNDASQASYKEEVNNFVPDNAVLLSEYIHENNIVFIDYQLDGVRYIVEYFKDGNIRKTSRVMDEDQIYTTATFFEGIKTQNVFEDSCTLYRKRPLNIAEIITGILASVMMFRYGVFIYRNRGESRGRARFGVAYMICASVAIILIILSCVTKQALLAALFYGLLVLLAVGVIIEVIYRKRK